MTALLLSAELWIAGGRVLDGGGLRSAAIAVDGGRIAGEADKPPPGARTVDANGLVLLPAFVDAHVHLSVAGHLATIAKAELRGGVAAVLDLGEPERLLPLATAPLRARFAGPLLTAPRGYPTQSWGANGYGLELATPEDARAAVRRLAKAGARFAKLAFDRRFPVLEAGVARAATEEAHRLGLRVAAHALDVEMVRRALDAGADVLAHTPVEPLPDDLVAAIGARQTWVISTLHAFGGTPQAVSNLRRLRRAGARVAYGTDLGNEGTAPGIDAQELALLSQAGLSAADVITACSAASAELVGEADLGHLGKGAAASIIGVRAEALKDVRLLAQPKLVLIDGAPPPAP
ncbi:MAG TPA: amidohydrolase family protein [Myxococcales bacterium]|jgi:imidazolonepropionase-like amidohydrolase|nr:amidohydrolase family protein [Myxococcales bacterium]